MSEPVNGALMVPVSPKSGTALEENRIVLDLPSVSQERDSKEFGPRYLFTRLPPAVAHLPCLMAAGREDTYAMQSVGKLPPWAVPLILCYVRKENGPHGSF